ncbi:MAG: peptidoglycan-binding protein [Chitinophagaceae bacterium]
MELLKKGSAGALVTELQTILQELDYNIPITGFYDTPTVNAVKDFQSSHLDKHGVPLEVDGKVGDITWFALHNPRVTVTGGVIDYKIMPGIEEGGSTLGRAALQIAINELKVGAGEIGGNNKGPFVKKYLQPVGLQEGEPWCAAFLSWCFLQACNGRMNEMPFRYSAGARAIFRQFRNKHMDIGKDDPAYVPLPGDIMAWWRVSLPSGKGHIAIVHHFKDGFIYTLEGNKAANVAGFSYVKTRIDKLLGYGRVPG